MPRTREPRDIEVGHRIRAQRLAKGMSQTVLADQLDLTFQQVQKYEKGTNRVGAGRLQRIAEILRVPISFFFGDSPDTGPQVSGFEFRFLDTAEAVRLFRAYNQISNPKIRRALVNLAQQIAGTDIALAGGTSAEL